MRIVMREEVVCIPNIGPKERRKRLTGGIVALVVGGVLALVLILSGQVVWTRLLLFLPFYGGFVGVFQAREKT
jgi:hypothetical protein